MKKIIILFSIFFAFNTITKAQMGEGPRDRKSPNGMEKIEQLEKIKLIEVLDMDEETTLKFFARKNEHNNIMKQLMDKSIKQLDAINEKLQEKSVDEKGLNSMIDKYFSIEDEILKERETFVKSVSDILSVTQIAKLVVFEKRFRDEIRDILFKTKIERRKH